MENNGLAAEAAVVRLVEILASPDEFTEDGIYAVMSAEGIPDGAAGRAFQFTQIACGRRFLDDMGVQTSPEYLLFNGDGDVVESGLLHNEPVYRTASTLVRKYWGFPGLARLAVMSADVQCVNAVLLDNDKIKMKDIIFGASGLFLEPMTPEAMAKAQRTIEQSIPTPKKPWWQFW